MTVLAITLPDYSFIFVLIYEIISIIWYLTLLIICNDKLGRECRSQTIGCLPCDILTGLPEFHGSTSVPDES